MFEEMMLRSLHVQSMRAGELHAGHDPHLLFQASTVSALLDGSYDGDLSFAELAGHGDTGLGTLNGLDGEMIALDGIFLRADVNGDVTEIAPNAFTPFAVVTEFKPTVEFEIARVSGFAELQILLDGHLPTESPAAAVRIDGTFRSVTARSVPKQFPPYLHLDEVVANQNVFEIAACSGSLVGFRFPIYSEGIEVAGYHLHFVNDARTRGGHVLGVEIESATVRAALYSDLHVELPPGMDLASPDLAGETHDAIERAERAQPGE
jgi:acetolactate decarboxylase